MLRQQFQSFLTTCANPTVHDLNAALLSIAREIFPAQRQKSSLPAWAHESVRAANSDLQSKRLALQSATDSGAVAGFLGRVFRGFKQVCDLLRSSKAARRASKRARSLRLQSIMHDVEVASAQGDIRLLYKIIRTLAPKTQRHRVQIHDESGMLLGPVAEMQELVGHFTKLFAPSDRILPITTPGTAAAFTEAEVAEKLRHVRCGIAVPPDCAPSACWRAVSDLAAPVLAKIANANLCGVPTTVPRLWADCWLSLLPKPHKSTRRPGDLRPLGIQEISGKALASVIKDRLFLEVGDVVCSYPQFAYISGRGTDAAIARVAEHCRLVRSYAGRKRVGIHQRQAGAQTGNLSGGAMLKLDMSTAFDLLPRHSLIAALVWAGCSTELLHLIITWHETCHYHVRHGSATHPVPLLRGIRQGCCLAPLLWAIYSISLSFEIAQIVGGDWITSSFTLFADDSHASWLLHTLDDSHFMLRCVQAIFLVFSRHGMVVNPGKSELVYTCAVPAIKRLLHQRKVTQRGTEYVDLGSIGSPLLIKLCSQLTYLGVIVSYTDFELATARFRCSEAETVRQRLRKILHDARHLSLRRRIQIYHACGRASMTYGILAAGITTSSLRHLCVCNIKHMRALSKAPVHLHFEPTVDLLARLKAPTVPEFLLKLANRRLQKAEPAFARMLIKGMQVLQNCMQPGSLLSAEHADQVPCPTCGIFFSSQATMRLHHARKHGVSLQAVSASEPAKVSEVQLADHYLGGVPTCRHCGAVYSRRQAFRNHILNTCPVLNKHRSRTPPGSGVSGVLPAVAERRAADSETKTSLPTEHPPSTPPSLFRFRGYRPEPSFSGFL